MDVTLKTDKLEVAAFVTRQLNLGSEAVATEFQPLDCEVRTADLDRVEGTCTASIFLHLSPCFSKDGLDVCPRECLLFGGPLYKSS